MTNQEKYGLTNEQVKRLSCEIDDFVMEQCAGSLSHLIEMFFREQVKPTLTEDEKVILRNVDEMYITIGRYEDGILEFNRSDGHYSNSCYPLNHLFQFIKPRRRI